MPIDFVKNEGKNWVIIFIHGLFGSKETWIPKVAEENLYEPQMKLGPQPLMQYLEEDADIASTFDFCLFHYYTKPISLFERLNRLLHLLFNTEMKRNLPIDDLKDLLKTEIEVKLKNKNIVFIAHSMGGIVAKTYILDILQNKQRLNVNMFISLAVPHQGSDWATIGKKLLLNPQIKYLAPLSGDLYKLNDQWIRNTAEVPQTIYCVGKNDTIVKNTAAIGHQVGEKDIKHLEYDHFSITKPKSKDEALVIYLKEKLKEVISREHYEGSNSIINDASNQQTEETILSSGVITNTPAMKQSEDSISNLKQELKNSLVKNPKLAVRILEEAISRDSYEYNSFVLLQGRINKVISDRDMGLIDSVREDIETNRIRSAFLNLIDALEEKDLKESYQTHSQVSLKSAILSEPTPTQRLLEENISSYLSRLEIDSRNNKDYPRDRSLEVQLNKTRTELRGYLEVNQKSVQEYYTKEVLIGRINLYDSGFCKPGDTSWICA